MCVYIYIYRATMYIYIDVCIYIHTICTYMHMSVQRRSRFFPSAKAPLFRTAREVAESLHNFGTLRCSRNMMAWKLKAQNIELRPHCIQYIFQSESRMFRRMCIYSGPNNKMLCPKP